MKKAHKMLCFLKSPLIAEKCESEKQQKDLVKTKL